MGGHAHDDVGGDPLMGTVIVPGGFVAPPNDVGRLAGALLHVALAGSVDRARLGRARQLRVDGAVLRLEVSAGSITAEVQGSRPDPYEVSVSVPTCTVRSAADTLDRSEVPSLVPQLRDLVVRCSCPDWEDPCKHSIAAMLVFADEVQLRPYLLREWREGEATTEAPAPGPSTSGQPAARQTVPEQSAPVRRRIEAPPPRRPAEHEAMADAGWPEFVGVLPVAQGPQVPASPVVTGNPVLDAVDLGDWLGSAHEAMRRGGRVA